MKKQLTLALGLAVLATPAFASKARLMALGEDANGSFFINDNRNIFLNAAEANNHADMVTFEFGNSNTADDNSTAGDANANAEGGALMGHKNFVYGVHLGRNTNFQNTANANNLYAPSNAIDLFLAGDAGFKWGANLTYVNSKNDTHDWSDGTTDVTGKADGQAIDLNLGATFGNAAVYVKGGLTGDGKTQIDPTGTSEYKAKFKRDNELEVGGSYKLNSYTIFGQVGMDEYTVKGGPQKDTLENMFYTIGAARTERLSDKTMMFVKLAGVVSNSEVKEAGVKTKTDTMAVPVSIGFEHDATSWLVLRGSVAQNLWSDQDEKTSGQKKENRTLASSTSVNAGATLKLGDFNVDGLIGTGNTGANAVARRDNQVGVLSMDNLMTRVSLTYRF